MSLPVRPRSLTTTLLHTLRKTFHLGLSARLHPAVTIPNAPAALRRIHGGMGVRAPG
jgi:hypothetical protein